MNTIKLLKRDQKSKKGLAQFDIKKRMYYFILKIYGTEIVRLKSKLLQSQHQDEYWEAVRSVESLPLTVYK